MVTVAASAFSVPVSLDRDAAAAAAAEELRDPIYTSDGQPWILTATRWVLEKLSSLIDTVTAAAPGGWLGLVIIAAAVIALALVIRRAVGRLRRSSATPNAVFGTGRRYTSGQYRAFAEMAAAESMWGEAVRQRVRATIRDLEERGLLDEQVGRTADEAASEAGLVLPECATGLYRAARLFDDVVYGGVTADDLDYERVCGIDDSVRRARPQRGRTLDRAGVAR